MLVPIKGEVSSWQGGVLNYSLLEEFKIVKRNFKIY